MSKFRKKPVVIEAVQFKGVGMHNDEGYPPGVCFCTERPELTVEGSPHAHVHTAEGGLKASVGDWIIKGVKGEFYPCKPDIFAETYDPLGTTP